MGMKSNEHIDILFEEAKDLLKKLICTPSVSREEDKTADIIQEFLSGKGIPVHRKKNNIWAYNKNFDSAKPTILLHSHHDTVKTNPGYQRDPYHAEEIEGKLYGLGSNDAGGCLVALLAAFLYYYEQQLNYNVCILASAVEEISGKNGIEMAYNEVEVCEFAIV